MQQLFAQNAPKNASKIAPSAQDRNQGRQKKFQKVRQHARTEKCSPVGSRSHDRFVEIF